ncbi:MAG: hypothetical protein HYT22_03445 [Candidatus Niyogibacteria bacterium]|nr:hypothetical protein [Candidatus Niyogibacteria bacterium]
MTPAQTLLHEAGFPRGFTRRAPSHPNSYTVLVPLVEACLLSETESCDVLQVERLLWLVFPYIHLIGPSETGEQTPEFRLLLAALGQPDIKKPDTTAPEEPIEKLIARIRACSRLRKLALANKGLPTDKGLHIKILYVGLTEAVASWDPVRTRYLIS